MDIILPTQAGADDEDLPLLNPSVGLLSENLLAGYAMLDSNDFSGKGNNFSWNGTFSSAGALLDTTTDTLIQTPILEEEEMSIIICANFPPTNDNASLINNFKQLPGGGYKGSRLVKLPNSAQVQMNTATGLNPGSVNAITTTLVGAWTIRCFNFKSTQLQEVYGSGSQGSNISTVSRLRNEETAYYINGVPSNISAGTITAGINGTLGFLLFYKEFPDIDVCVQRMNIVKEIMKARGVVVP